MSGFTPGPWRVRASPHGKRYACVQLGRDKDYTTLELEPADARLIAAAPELLEACKDALRDLIADGHEHYRVVDTLRAAIAKAEQQ
jgi:hypothetical protein